MPGSLSNADFTAFADATIAMQRDCNARGITCTLVDLRALSDDSPLLLPVLPSGPAVGRLEPWAVSRLQDLRQAGRLLADPSAVPVSARERRPPWTTLLLADSGAYAFLVAVNQGAATRRVGPFAVSLRGRARVIAPFTIAARSMRVVPVGVSVVGRIGGTVASGRKRRRRFGIPTARRSLTRTCELFSLPSLVPESPSLERTRKFGNEHRAFARRDRSRAARVVARLHRALHAPDFSGNL